MGVAERDCAKEPESVPKSLNGDNCIQWPLIFSLQSFWDGFFSLGSL